VNIPPENGARTDASSALAEAAVPPSPLARYSVAVGVVLAATAARSLLASLWWPNALLFAFFYPAIVVAAWYGRFGAALVAVALSALAAEWFFMKPPYSLGLSHPSQLAAVVCFVAVSLFLAAVIERMHRANRGLVRSLQERTLIEEALRNREAELELIINQTPFMLTRCSRDLRYQFVSRAYAQMTGRRPEDIVGQSIVAIIGEEGFRTIAPHVEQVLRGNRVEYESRVHFQESGVRFLHVVYTPDIDAHGAVKGWIASILDLTSRKQAEEAGQAAELRYRTVGELIPFGVWESDAEGNATYLSQLFLNITGLTLEEHREIWQSCLHAEDMQPTVAAWRECVRTGSLWEREFRLCGKDGEYRTILSRGVPLRHKTGEVSSYVGINYDITERRRAEEALRQAQRELLQRAKDLEATVAERTAKLSESVNELQSVSYSITHDMRAPLRAMSTFAQLLLDQSAETGASAETREYCRRILTGACRLDKLITDALNYTNAVLPELSLEPVDLTRLIRGLVETYPNLQAETALVRIEGSLPWVLGNESLLTQCFSNLLGNAVKFVAPGTRPDVRVRANTSDHRARVWVEDNGIGIPQHAQSRLFGMFQKLDNQYEGTGIGLAIVRKVVERMGGQVGVESAAGRGSRFWVELKLQPPNAS
jgi:PAS domain S-box-containing protein